MFSLPFTVYRLLLDRLGLPQKAKVKYHKKKQNYLVKLVENVYFV